MCLVVYIPDTGWILWISHCISSIQCDTVSGEYHIGDTVWMQLTFPRYSGKEIHFSIHTVSFEYTLYTRDTVSHCIEEIQGGMREFNTVSHSHSISCVHGHCMSPPSMIPHYCIFCIQYTTQYIHKCIALREVSLEYCISCIQYNTQYPLYLLYVTCICMSCMQYVSVSIQYVSRVE